MNLWATNILVSNLALLYRQQLNISVCLEIGWKIEHRSYTWDPDETFAIHLSILPISLTIMLLPILKSNWFRDGRRATVSDALVSRQDHLL